jgi:23S rRNA (cytidine1920-2'-O)/16S rRNA (cytidine1409-2'-O)-methyltransferase
VYAIDTGYGMLDYRLRKDDRVVVMERTNALHARVPEPVELIAIDVAWTPQRLILPAARAMLGGGGGLIVTLVKPHYEAGPGELIRGKLPDEKCPGVLDRVESELDSLGLRVDKRLRSPIVGTKASNPEWLWLVRAKEA